MGVLGNLAEKSYPNWNFSQFYPHNAILSLFCWTLCLKYGLMHDIYYQPEISHETTEPPVRKHVPEAVLFLLQPVLPRGRLLHA